MVCFAFTVQINLLLNHLTLWDSSSVREMSSLLLFLSSKCFKCFLRFLCFLWDLCFRWPCFLSLDFGDSGWPTVFVDRGDMLGSLCSMNWIVLRVSVGAIFSFRSIQKYSFHLAWKCFGAGWAPEQQLPIPHNWGGGKSLPAGWEIRLKLNLILIPITFT